MFKCSVIFTILLVGSTLGKVVQNGTKKDVRLVIREELPLGDVHQGEDGVEVLELELGGLEDLSIDLTLMDEEVIELRWRWRRILCSPCKAVFNVLKKELKDGAGLTKEALHQAIDKQCKRKLGHLVGKVCSKLAGKGVDALYDLIVKEDKRIDPERCCKKVGICK